MEKYMNDKIIDTKNEKEVKKKFFTKDRLCWLAVGLIVGAAIASAGFLIYINMSGNQSGMGPGNPPEMSEDGSRPAMPNGGTPPEMGDGETPPELPDGETPPEMPAGETPESDTSSGTNESSSDSSTESNASSKKSKTKSAE